MLLIPFIVGGVLAGLIGLALWIWAIRLNEKRRKIKKKMVQVQNTTPLVHIPPINKTRKVSTISVEHVDHLESPIGGRESISISVPEALELTDTQYTPMVDKEELYLALRHSIVHEGTRVCTNNIPFNPLAPSLGLTLTQVPTRDCMQITGIDASLDHRYPGVRIGDFVYKIDGIAVTDQDEVDAALDDAAFMNKHSITLVTCNEFPVHQDSPKTPKNRRQSRSTAVNDSHSYIDIESFRSIDDHSHPSHHYPQLLPTPDREDVSQPFRKIGRRPRRYHGHDNAFSSIASSDMPVV
eukprot:TRINITY_DN7141_c0_g1_i1.p1 TRINITY_DN7141_c0_g1~~TRINITY_DN7141_c0_g1_i1.p1  ORF type:complete len:296 (+),score=32.01 TRINITY_DN7141_c0_g1_i1:40-927(+)